MSIRTPRIHRHAVGEGPSPTGRRRFIGQIGAAGGLLLAQGLVRPSWAEWSDQAPSSLFTLGVASGDPTSSSVVIWTRLAPDPLNGGGMGDAPVQVSWRVGRRTCVSRSCRARTTRPATTRRTATLPRKTSTASSTSATTWKVLAQQVMMMRWDLGVLLGPTPPLNLFNVDAGYVLCDVTPGQWRADFRAVDRVADPVFTVPSADTPLFTRASFVLTAGAPGLTQTA